MHSYVPAYSHTLIRVYTLTFIHSGIDSSIHSYINTCVQIYICNGSEGIQFKNSAPLKVNQDIVLTLPEYAVCSVSWAE